MTIFGEKNNVFELYKTVLGPFLASLYLNSSQIDYLKKFKKNSIDPICASISLFLYFFIFLFFFFKY